MSGVTPLVDTLLATRLAQRVDLVPLKGQVDIGDPGFANQVEQVTNDVRLSSRELLQQQLGVGVAADAGGGGANSAQSASLSDEAVTLSAVARALAVILETPLSGGTQRIFGSAALWPGSQPSDTQQLTATLAHTVANSGLFYESHLQQYVAGTRTLAQLAQEPQAQLGSPTGLPAPSFDKDPAGVVAPPPDAAGHDKALTAAIHPGSLALVRQQLELLAQPQFRWSGEAWPGITMDWDIQEEQDANQGAADDAAARHNWTTRLAMNLPTLGLVEARLSLAGSTLQLRLAAREQATVSLLGEARTELPQRFGAQGLQLTGFQIASLAAEPALPT